MRAKLDMISTTYGPGPFHPAVRDSRGSVWFWPNITYETEDEAVDWANTMLSDAEREAQTVVDLWNIVIA